LGRLPQEDIRSGIDVVKAYQAKWRRNLSPEAFFAAMNFAPLLAVFAYAAGPESWRNPTMLREPGSAACFRSLTRRMHVEMRTLEERRALC